MKHLYFIIFFFFISFASAQNSANEGEIKGFKLYPNPVTNSKVYISTTQNDSKDILIFDVLGTKVLQTTISGSELNIADLDAGVYVMRVYERNNLATRKLIVR